MEGLLSKKLLMARLERGLTLRDAAKLTGVSKETISELERGKRKPHPPTLYKLAQGYEVKVADLLAQEEETALTAGKADAPYPGQAEPSKAPGSGELFAATSPALKPADEYGEIILDQAPFTSMTWNHVHEIIEQYEYQIEDVSIHVEDGLISAGLKKQGSEPLPPPSETRRSPWEAIVGQVLGTDTREISVSDTLTRALEELVEENARLRAAVTATQGPENVWPADQ
jgi:transcriptional regulator with XRE-family HTH domain